MKKVFALALALVMALSFAACSPSIGMPNPFVTYGSTQEASKAVGFDVVVPNTVEGYTKGRIIQGVSSSSLSMIQVLDEAADGNTLCIRKARGTGDISGDSNTYSISKKVTVGARSVTLKGNGNDQFKVAIWTKDNYTYAVVATAGLSEEAMIKIIQQVL